MSWRRLLPLLLVGLLSVAAAAAAALGIAQSQSPEVRVLSPEAQSRLFHADVARTLASKSLTVHFAGQTTVYQAPNRTEVQTGGPDVFGTGMSSVSIGPTSYVDFEGHWVKAPIALPGVGTAPQVLSSLRALDAFRSARLDGNTFTVHGVLSDLPKALVTLIFTAVTHGPNGEIDTSYGPAQPNQDRKVVGRVVVNDGRVVAETFTALGAHPSGGRGRGSGSSTGTVSYTRFDSSPAITGPTKAELAPPCDVGANGSCQVTTKGTAPDSPLCRVIRAHVLKAGSPDALKEIQTASASGQWKKVRNAILDFMDQEESLSRAIGPTLHNAPSNVQAAAQEGVGFFRAEKAVLRKAKSSSQFSAQSAHFVEKLFAATGPLAQYEGTRCGSTASYSQSQGGGQQGSFSTQGSMGLEPTSDGGSTTP